MKTAVMYGPRDIRIEEVEIPKVGPSDALIRVKACGICGSDVHRYLGTRYGQRFRYPLNSGHEYSGEVVKVGGNVKKFKIGDRVTLGVDWIRGGYGAFSEFVRVIDADKNLHRIPDGISYEEAALIEPLLVALNGLCKFKLEEKDRVIIFGAGPIGLCLLQICLNICSEGVVISEISPRRLELASRIGAITVNPLNENLEKFIESWTDGKGVDVAFECAGARETLNQAFSLTRRRGRICLIAHYSQGAEIDPEVIVGNSLNVYGPEYGAKFFSEAISLIVEGKVRLRPLISHEFPLDEAARAFETAANTKISVKVLIKP